MIKIVCAKLKYGSVDVDVNAKIKHQVTRKARESPRL